MKRIINMRTGMGAAAVALVTLLAAGSARAERRPPFGNDAQLLEANVRDQVTRRIAPVLEEMAPGQAELKYVDVRVNRPTALPAGAAPGFEELTPGTEFVAERVEVAVTLDSKLPAQFRKDLKNLLKSKLDMLDVPVEITESVIAFPTPRPQPQQREMSPYAYPPPPQPAPQREREQPAPQPYPVAAAAARAGRRQRDAWNPLDRGRRARHPGPPHRRARLRPAERARRPARQAQHPARVRPRSAQRGVRLAAHSPRRSIISPRSGARCARIACWPAA